LMRSSSRMAALRSGIVHAAASSTGNLLAV
jgi:hypothetical protein